MIKIAGKIFKIQKLKFYMENFRSRNGENRNIRQPAIGLVNELYEIIRYVIIAS